MVALDNLHRELLPWWISILYVKILWLRIRYLGEMVQGAPLQCVALSSIALFGLDSQRTRLLDNIRSFPHRNPLLSWGVTIPLWRRLPVKKGHLMAHASSIGLELKILSDMLLNIRTLIAPKIQCQENIYFSWKLCMLYQGVGAERLHVTM